ncbi:hypothetical protein ACA910_008419 [Epithemia clementina (nom. ined.)]
MVASNMNNRRNTDRPKNADENNNKEEEEQQQQQEQQQDEIKFRLYGYSPQEPFFAGQEYWEWGVGYASRVDVPSPMQHCTAHFTSFLQVGRRVAVTTASVDNSNHHHNDSCSSWTRDVGSYFWNQIRDGDQNHLMGGGKGAICYFQRIQNPTTCLQLRAAVLDKFAEILGPTNTTSTSCPAANEEVLSSSSSLSLSLAPSWSNMEIPASICTRKQPSW